jgi:hypothetical protein
MRNFAIPRRTRRGDAGFILILAIVALVMLTTMGLAAVSAAEMDMRIARNLRLHRQVTYVALAGVEHARSVMLDEVDDMRTAFDNSNQQAPSFCINGYIGSGGLAVDTPIILDTPLLTTNPFGTYTVNLCRVMCVPAPHGNDLASSSTGKVTFSGAVMDATATSTRANDPSSSSAAGTLFQVVQIPCEVGS